GDGRAVGEGLGVTASVSQRADLDDVSDGTELVHRPSLSTPAELRVDFGAHLEANYQRLVAQLYAITLNPGEAHDVVQDAYSRAWRDWERISREADPTGWVRSVAVRSSARSWRRIFGGRSHADGEADPRTAAMLAALK